MDTRILGVENRVRDWLQGQLTDSDVFLLDVKKSGNKLLILIDGDSLVPIQKCVEISRLTGAWLEEQDIDVIPGTFTLEVSSPGADSPLILPRQFPKHIGRLVEVRMKNEHKAEGVLLQADALGITIRQAPVKVKASGSGQPGQEAVPEAGRPNERRIELREINDITVKLDFKGLKP